MSADSTAWATQVRLMAPQLLKRLAEELGHGTVRHIRVNGPAGPPRRPGACGCGNAAQPVRGSGHSAKKTARRRRLSYWTVEGVSRRTMAGGWRAVRARHNPHTGDTYRQGGPECR